MARIAFIIFTILITMVSIVYSKEVKTSLPSNEYFIDRNVEIVTTVSENKIQLARQRDILLYQGFDEYGEDQKHQKDIGRTHIFRWECAFPDGWKFTNFKNALKASIYKENDTHNAYLVISGSDKGGDTAFELSSPMLPVEAGKPYTLTFRCQLSKKMIAHSGHKGKYETGIIWLTSDNKKIVETPFSLLNEEGNYNDWYTRKIEVISPERAIKAIIRFGFDLPNLELGDFVLFDDIQFATLSNKYEHEGEFVSRPLSIESDNLSFTANADIPQGTSIQFQIRFAADNDGVPGTWTSFVEHNQMTTPQSPSSQGENIGEAQKVPKTYRQENEGNKVVENHPHLNLPPPPLSPSMRGTGGGILGDNEYSLPLVGGVRGGGELSQKVFTQECYKWLQYRAVLHTTKPDTTPAFHSVTINNSNGTSITDSGWSGPDTKPPEIVWRSPTRTEQAGAPISFRLCDNTGGFGIKSVEAYLDGKKVELLQSKSNENEYTLKTNGPLKPLERDTGLSAWKIENYQNALAVERSPEIVTFINTSESTSYVDTAFKMCSPKIPVIENTKYALSFYSRYNTDFTQLKHWGQLSSGIIWRDRNGKEIGEPYRLSFGVAHTKWHRDVHKVTSPSGAVSAEICFGWDSPNLNNGDFFSIKDVCFEGQRPDVTCEPNLHKVEVKACDLAGNKMQKMWYVLVKKIPMENIITLRDDGMTLIDDKPFFPIGIYAVQKSKVNNYNIDNAFKELKDAGFNTPHTYMKERNNDFAEFYSTAARYGMKVFAMTSAGHNSTDIDTIVHDVATEVDQPTLLSWYLADDTSSYISSKDLKNIHEIIKGIDPYHLTSQADAVGVANRYKGYGDATDIFLPELYPIRTKGNNEISEVIRDMKHVKEELERSGCNQGIWAIVQDFKGWGWKRYPTDEEVRAMTYLSIIHGATGIMYYTYGGWGENYGAPFDRHVWTYLKKVVGELASLHDVLAERNTIEKCTSSIIKGVEKDGMGYPALNTLLKVYQGKHYLFAANSAQEKIRSQFKPAKLLAGWQACTLAGQKKVQYQLMPATENISEVSVMFEDRTLPVKDGVFVDDFKAYDVHVYQW